MKVFELLEFNRTCLKLMKDNGVKLNDVEYISLFADYMDMKDKSYKVTYIVAHLAEKYGVSVRHVYALVKRMGSDCKKSAVGTKQDCSSVSPKVLPLQVL